MRNPEVCGRCGQEIRHGIRDGITGWLHRETVDHAAVLGRHDTQADIAERDRQYREVIRYYDDGTTYTTAGHDIMRDIVPDRRKARLAELRVADQELAPIAVEIYAHDVDPAEIAPRSGIRQVINLAAKNGWDLVSFRHSRGPYMGSRGEALSVSDSHVVKVRAPAGLDEGVRIAVISWRDGKFDFAYIGTINDGHLEPRKVDATTMKNWIKGMA